MAGQAAQKNVRIDELIARCEYATEMMKRPLAVEIKNLDKEINSRFDDYAPSITADGTTLVFTSRRPDALQRVDENGDHKYYEDIYVSEWISDEMVWSSAEPFSEAVNSPTHDAVLSMSADGKTLFVYKNDVDRAGDIFVSTQGDKDWSTPEKMPRPINTSYFESSVSITSDGQTMYFISERPSGEGRGDIYVSQRKGENSWSKPKNIGPVLNTEHDEKFVFIHPSGSTLFFASDGHRTMGGYDIFRSERVAGEWMPPVNLGYPINTVNEESTFSMTADNRQLFISAEYEGGVGERDIYVIDISGTDILQSLQLDEAQLAISSNVRVFGEVRSPENDRVLAFAELRLSDEAGQLMAETTTNKDGQYEILLPRDGRYSVSIKPRRGKSFEAALSSVGMDGQETELERSLGGKKANP